MKECIFCKILSKEIPAEIVYEDDDVLAFKDLEPKAPVHILVIPKKHRQNILDLRAEDAGFISHIFLKVIPKIAQSMNISQDGFRLVTNIGKDGGQTVGHLHFHLLGGRFMNWPPG